MLHMPFNPPPWFLLSLPYTFKKLSPLTIFISSLISTHWNLYCGQLLSWGPWTISTLPNSVDALFNLHLVQSLCDIWKYWLPNPFWNSALFCFLEHWFLPLLLSCPLLVTVLVGTHFPSSPNVHVSSSLLALVLLVFSLLRYRCVISFISKMQAIIDILT